MTSEAKIHDGVSCKDGVVPFGREDGCPMRADRRAALTGVLEREQALEVDLDELFNRDSAGSTPALDHKVVQHRQNQVSPRRYTGGSSNLCWYLLERRAKKPYGSCEPGASRAQVPLRERRAQDEETEIFRCMGATAC